MRPARVLLLVAWVAWLAVPIAVPRAALAQETPSPDPVASAECVGCHALPDIQIADDGKYRPGLYVTRDALAGSMHAAFACIDCHSALESTMHARRDVARESCGTCHEQERADYEAGYHFTGEEGPRPTCITCHGSHQVQNAETRDFLHRASEQCDRCHTQMNERFVSGNPFGMDTHLAGVDVATCADCHGFHTVLPASDPASPVNQANILETCRQCHTNAPPNFVDVQMHIPEGPIPDDPRLRIITIYMLTLLIGTFGFFGYLTALGIRFEWRKQAERAQERARSRSGTGGVL